ncbi:MAG: hypothetical protein IV089_02365 [Thiobacillus sp.]|nr:hypothetical protein [Thiobacillus sp.]
MKWMILFTLCVSQAAAAEPSRPDFHRLVHALHEQQLASHTVRTEEESGAYNGTAAAGYRYRVTRYYDAKTGRLLSRIQRDAKVSVAIHIAEVNIYDANGQLIRDYLSMAPPWKPLHPSNAYLNLHHYNGKLHSFRQFELDGQVNYEFCEGELGGKPVRISLPWDDMNKESTSTPEYRACFDAMSKDWKLHITPH